MGPTLSATEIRQASAGSVGVSNIFVTSFGDFALRLFTSTLAFVALSPHSLFTYEQISMKGEQSRRTTSNGNLEVCVKCSSSLHIWGRNSHYFGKILI